MKKIYPHSILIIINELLFTTIVILCLVAIVFAIKKFFNTYDWYYILIFLSAILVGISTFIYLLSFLKKKIILKDNMIAVHADMADKRGLSLRRLQHETSIFYEDIKDIYLCATSRDSDGHQVKYVFVEMPYIVFDLKNGQTKLINVYYYSKTQVTNLIDEVKNKAALLGNDIKISGGREVINNFIYKK